MKSLAFNFRIAVPALLCCVALARTAGAQEAASSWVKFAPPSGTFSVMMPRTPSPVAERANSGTLSVTGHRYQVRHEDAEYTVWSFEPASPSASGDDEIAYLEQCGEIARRVIVKPAGWLKPKRGSLTYDKRLSFQGLPGMRYRVNFGKQSGIAHVYAVGSQIYIVAAWGAARASASIEEFIKAFTLNLPVPAGGNNARRDGIGDGSVKEPGSTVYSRIYFAREVAQKARLLKKPEPVFTEGAREFGVTGKVRVRLILWPSGAVSNIRPLSFLPHGSTWEAMEAARRIKFTPAMKDGRAVPQYVTVEYNFNIY